MTYLGYLGTYLLPGSWVELVAYASGAVTRSICTWVAADCSCIHSTKTTTDLQHIWASKSTNLDYIWILKGPAQRISYVHFGSRPQQIPANPRPVGPFLLQAPSFPSLHPIYPTRSMWVK
jgi:hypothetical protein